jgi:hypothetical protein
MKLITWVALALLSSACTTLRPTDATPEEVQRLIKEENLIAPGDRVKLATANEQVHQFKVQRVDIDGGLVLGKDKAVPIADIVAVETRELSVGKTILLTGGVAYGTLLLILLLAAPAFVMGGA